MCHVSNQSKGHLIYLIILNNSVTQLTDFYSGGEGTKEGNDMQAKQPSDKIISRAAIKG